MRPLVSICVPTCNRAASLRATLPSICGQDYDNLEILISDNGSTDETEAVCREAAARDSRIRYIRQPKNIGLYQNHNVLLDAARGEFICICHDHDDRTPDMVSSYLAFLQAHPDVGVVCSDWNVIDEKTGAHLGVREHAVPEVTPGLEFVNQTLRRGRSSVGAPGVMIRREALGDIRFDEQGAIGFGDFVLWFRIAERWNIGHLSRKLWSWAQEPHAQSVRRIVSLIEDYDRNLNTFCDGFLQRHPDRAELVKGWRRLIRRYIFWALVYEVALHFRKSVGTSEAPTLFEIHRYQLSQEEFDRAVERLGIYRTGLDQAFVLLALKTLIALRLTGPLGWMTRHYGSLRVMLGLR